MVYIISGDCCCPCCSVCQLLFDCLKINAEWFAGPVDEEDESEGETPLLLHISITSVSLDPRVCGEVCAVELSEEERLIFTGKMPLKLP